ncbi:hypothetical protein NLO413_0843 [Candidatus Neoehrlichia lotoris str. RAC413]|uniref:Uncharacterized protein n=1 Tax=Candidatus Neoehrlichia procyonis str. RAC413 TaxID=1359163 RepID=A0A0F3NN13_9RICK|nr:hypothetical protein NLO413_0843 [Candidatus Neoehrlichia lotoris str. RAC413]
MGIYLNVFMEKNSLLFLKTILFTSELKLPKIVAIILCVR